MALADMTLALATDRAVFSHSAIDAGTKYLLMEAPKPPEAGTLLDLGCGYGPIACALARRSPGAHVVAVDINERARQLCVDNAAANELPNVTVDTDAPGPFAAIYSNPPIRIGKVALHALLTTWLARLDVGAPAYLVVHQHLGADSLQRWLSESGWAAERYGTRQGYRILDVRR